MVAADLESIKVLARYVAVGADVYDIETLDRAAQMLDRSRYDAPSDHRLAQADLVGDQKATGSVGQIEPLEYVVHRRALKILQTGECLGSTHDRIGMVLHLRLPTRLRATLIDCQTSRNSAGNERLPSSVAERSFTSEPTASIFVGSPSKARSSSSSSGVSAVR